jgi:anti-sigma factor RsiW
MLRCDPSEDDLHAFVDGELAGDRLDGVTARLRADRAAVGRVAAYAEQRAALAALREELALMAPPSPAVRDLEQALCDAVRRQRRVRRPAVTAGAAAVVAMAVAAIGYKSWPAIGHRTWRQAAA